MSHEEFDSLSPLYALGALDGEEFSRFEAHLGTCPDCGKAVREYREASTAVALAVPPVAPSPSVRERILRQVRPARSRRLELAAAAAVLLAAVTGMLWWRASRQIEDLRSELADKEKDLGASRAEIARIKGDLKTKEEALALRSEVERILGHNQSTASPMKGSDAAKTATGRVVRLDRDIAIVAYGLAQIDPKKAYVLWVFEDGKPVSVGDYKVDAKGNLVAIYKLPKDFKGTQFALSVEDDDDDYPSPTEVVLLPAQ